MYAAVAGEAKSIDAISAVKLPGGKLSTKPSKNTGKHQKVKPPIVGKKKTEDYEILKKTWMIILRAPIWFMIRFRKFRYQAPLVAVFAAKKAKSSTSFPGEDMAGGKRTPIYHHYI